MTRRDGELLLGEWAALGALVDQRAHGFAVAARLGPDGDIGRVWSMSRALTYRALSQLEARELIHGVGEERGAGPNRRLLAPTPRGRRRLRAWCSQPVDHLRDLRSELLLKLLLGRICRIDTSGMLAAQREVVTRLTAALDAATDRPGADVVDLWRSESAHAALRFLERVAAGADETGT